MECLNWLRERRSVFARPTDHGAGWLSKCALGILLQNRPSPLKSTLAICFALVTSSVTAQAGSCSAEFVDLRWQGGKARFAIELADTYETRARGLMFRTEMARFSGMLFVYPEPSAVAFWMKNTLIPLDMIFINPQGLVTRVHENAIPHNLEPIPGGENILAVLEVNGGLTRKLGITKGSQIRHASFDQTDAVWPCE